MLPGLASCARDLCRHFPVGLGHEAWAFWPCQAGFGAEPCGLSRPCGESGQPGAPRKGLAQVSYLPLGTMRATERNSGKPSTEEVDGPRICAQGLVVGHLVHGRLHVQIVGRTAHIKRGFKCQGTVAEHLGVSVS